MLNFSQHWRNGEKEMGKDMPSIFADPMRGDGGGGGGCGVSVSEYVEMCASHVTWSPNILWRSTSMDE